MPELTQLKDFITEIAKEKNISIEYFSSWFYNKKFQIKVIIENKEQNTSINDCVFIHKNINLWLKNNNLLNKCFINVESHPIYNRQLFKIEDFEKFKNQKIKIELKDKIQDKKNLKGFIKKTNYDLITIINEEGEIEINFNEIKRTTLLNEGKINKQNVR